MRDGRSLTVDDILTPELRSWIGRSSGPFALPEEISASDVRRYVEATGDRNPLWLDDAFAQAHGHRTRVVPPALIAELSWRVQDDRESRGRAWHADLPLPAGYSDARNAELDIDWLRPVYVGDRLTLRHRITDIQVREGRAGLGVYMTRESAYARAGEDVAHVRQTIVRLPRQDSTPGRS